MTITVTPYTAAIGAVVTGLCPRAITASQTEQLTQAIHTYGVVFLPGVHLDDAAHLALAQALGTPSVYPQARLRGVSEPTPTLIASGPAEPPEADMWHTDVTWVGEPPTYALLCSITPPPVGGDTMWASTVAAYDRLSVPMRSFVDGLTATHDSTTLVAGIRRRTPGPEGEERARRHLAAFPPVIHPLVRTQPETGRRALFLSPPTIQRINELTTEESAWLLGHLNALLDDPRLQCRWRWSAGDLAIWDERSTTHRSVGDSGEQVRIMRRLEVDGDRPYFDATR